MNIGTLAVPILSAFIICYGMYKKVDVFSEFTSGAKEGLISSAELIPTLVALVTAVGMFRASGASDMITSFFSQAAQKLGFPPECLPLALIRPISGSGALAVYESILKDNPPDSFAGRVASVMIGSTETTFYTAAVYYGAVHIKNTKHTIAASLAGDIAGFIFSVLTVNLIFRMGK
ncbi:MAG: spore maturation protein [Huintestinicola sp.]